MIEIRVDKESELLWLQNVIGAGVSNSSQTYTMMFLGVPLRQNINYKLSDNFEDDIKEKREEFNKRFVGLRRMHIEDILRKEYNKTN